MRRASLLGLAVLGLLGSLAAGPISARATSTIFSQGNSARTERYVPPHKVEAAVVDQATTCAAATYTSGPVPGAVDTVALVDTGGSTGNTKRLCIRNAGRDVGRIRFVALNAVDTEVTCEAEEVDPALGNDLTCSAPGQPVTGTGELSRVLDLAVTPDGTNPAGCGQTQLFPFAEVNALPGTIATFRTLATSVAPGETCRYRWSGQVPGTATENERHALQTDELRWSFQFNLEDVPAP